MPATFTKSPDSDVTRLPSGKVSARAAKGIAWSSMLFALLQSICTFFVAVDGLRVAIGVGSLTIGAWMGSALDRFHTDWVRVPMITFALGGALLNLVILAQIRRLRNRPASQWRKTPLSSKKIWTERLQLTLSLVTLALVGLEEYLHFGLRGHL
jgi:hypothetical protein